MLYEALLEEFSVAQTAQLIERSRNKLKAFGKFLHEIIANEPIPFTPVKGGGK